MTACYMCKSGCEPSTAYHLSFLWRGPARSASLPVDSGKGAMWLCGRACFVVALEWVWTHEKERAVQDGVSLT